MTMDPIASAHPETVEPHRWMASLPWAPNGASMPSAGNEFLG